MRLIATAYDECAKYFESQGETMNVSDKLKAFGELINQPMKKIKRTLSGKNLGYSANRNNTGPTGDRSPNKNKFMKRRAKNKVAKQSRKANRR